MLKLILGRAKTGKTAAVMAEIQSRLAEGTQCVLLIPEQYSHEAEREMLARCGDRMCLGAEVLSFTRLAARVEGELGGGRGSRPLDPGGRLLCLDLNTLQLDWVQDIWDDSNGTPVLSIEDGHPYIYVGTSFHLGWRSQSTANVALFKVDAENGDIIWQKEYKCYSEKGVSGGIQSTVAIGQNDLAGYVYVTVAKTDKYNNGILACLDCETGEVVWEHHAYYTWSSPVLIYNSDGSGCLLYCNYGSMMYLIDAKTGKELDTFNLAGGVEASPAVYENTVVVGTRQCRIWGVKMS